MTDSTFADILAANDRYAEQFRLGGLRPEAAKGLGVLTCIDSRIEPLQMLGLERGDAKILRNAGARVTDDALRSLILASNLLNAKRIMVMAHTDCALGGRTNAQVIAELEPLVPQGALDGIDFRAAADQQATLRLDLERIRSCPAIAPGTVVAGFICDVVTSQLHAVG